MNRVVPVSCHGNKSPIVFTQKDWSQEQSDLVFDWQYTRGDRHNLMGTSLWDQHDLWDKSQGPKKSP